MRLNIAARALLVLAAIWSAVWAVRAVAGANIITADAVALAVDRAGFADWSSAAPSDPALASARADHIKRISGLIERLDYTQRIGHRQLGTAERMYARLGTDERRLFVDLTVLPAMESFLKSLETLTPRQRKRFLEIGNGELAKQPASSDPIYQQTVKLLGNLEPKALRAFLRSAPPDLLFQLRPLVESVNDALQGMAGPRFGPPHQHDRSGG